MFLFSGGCPSAYIKQSLFIHSTSGNGGKPVKKIPASATVLPTMKVEVQSPYNRITISYNRKGHRAFAVFLLSFWLESAAGLLLVLSVVRRLSIWIFMFSKIQIDWRKKEWHITTDVRTGSGVSGNRFCMSCIFTKIF